MYTSWLLGHRQKFDCVEMNWEIQKQIQKEFSGVPDAQAREIEME
jgi:hypothetical protein